MADLDKDLLQYPDRVSETFTGKTILVTGGTGFMGKVLVEKLLRRCCNLKKIYVVVRTKKGKDPNERLKDIFSGPLYDMVKEQRGEKIMEKVEAIAGNMEEVQLGISKQDRERLAKEVEIIYHCAATVRFDEALKKATLLNVRGTKYMLELAKECKKLMVFCHVSTAYCHLHEKVLHEKAYPPPADPHNVIRTAEWMSNEVMECITKKILGDYPNSYAFTKALGESLVVDEMNNLPVIILRPSVVIPIWKEPIPGWTDNINGPTGLLIGAGKGVLRTMYCKGDSYADYLPVDIAVNAMVLCCYDYLHYGVRRIYNVTSSAEYKISFEDIIEMGKKIIKEKMPLNGVAWYPGGAMRRSRLMHNICFYLFHIAPAILVDCLLFLLGYEPVLMRVQRRIAKGFEVFEYYANNQWDFNNDESMLARNILNPREKALYKVDGNGLNYEEYFTDCIHCARLYILNESDDTLPAARRHMRVMWWVDVIFKVLIAYGFLYFLYCKVFLPLFS